MPTLDELGKALDDAWVAMTEAQEKSSALVRSYRALHARKNPKALTRWQEWLEADKETQAARKVYNDAHDAYTEAGGN